MPPNEKPETAEPKDEQPKAKKKDEPKAKLVTETGRYECKTGIVFTGRGADGKPARVELEAGSFVEKGDMHPEDFKSLLKRQAIVAEESVTED